jgi:hypothetical protein
MPIWAYVGDRLRSESTVRTSDPCLALIDRANPNEAANSNCSDAEFVAYVDYNQSVEKEKKMNAEERFLRLFLNNEMDEEIAKQNFLNSLNWDSRLDLPAEPRLVHLANRNLHYGKWPSALTWARQRR